MFWIGWSQPTQQARLSWGTFCRCLSWAEGRRGRETAQWCYKHRSGSQTNLDLKSYRQHPIVLSTSPSLYVNGDIKSTVCAISMKIHKIHAVIYRAEAWYTLVSTYGYLSLPLIEEIREEAEHRSQNLAPGGKILLKSHLCGLSDFTLFSSQSEWDMGPRQSEHHILPATILGP